MNIGHRWKYDGRRSNRRNWSIESFLFLYIVNRILQRSSFSWTFWVCRTFLHRRLSVTRILSCILKLDACFGLRLMGLSYGMGSFPGLLMWWRASGCLFLWSMLPCLTLSLPARCLLLLVWRICLLQDCSCIVKTRFFCFIGELGNAYKPILWLNLSN